MKKIYFLLLFTGLQQLSAQNVEFTKDNFKANKEGLRNALKSIDEGDQLFKQADEMMELSFKEGYRMFNNAASMYKHAIPSYMIAQSFNPSNAVLNFKIGWCMLFSNTKTKAIPYLEKAYSLNSAVDPRIHYALGRAYHLNLEWDKGIKEYNIYKQTLVGKDAAPKIEDVAKKISECNNGIELVKKPVRVFIDNVGFSINSQLPEYGPVISADESMMIFTSRRENTTGGGRDMFNEFFEDIYVTTKIGGKWGPAKNIGTPINTEGHDATSGLSADGQKLLIYIDKGKDKGDLYECVLKGELWSKPENLGKTINTNEHESSAAYTFDANTLYFVSDKQEDNLGDRDIYVCTRDAKGKWGKATNIGMTINTKYGEEGAFIHPDGKTLYFSSQGHKSMGGFDIFKCVYDDKTKTWSRPENLGYPVNTPDDDVFFVLSASGRHGYYASVRSDGYGEKDIYMITFLGAEKPPALSTEDNLLASLAAPVKENVMAPMVEVKASLTILKGTVVDALTKKPLESTIDLIDNQRNEIVATFTSNATSGKYLVSLPAGKNYGIAVKKDGYLFHSENFDIPASAAYQEVVKDIELKNVKVGTKIVLKNIFFDFDRATLRPESTNELERLTKLLNDLPTMKIEISGHTDSKGSDEYNLKLSQSRAQTVVDYLIAKGIGKDRLKAAGYGETKPIDTNDTDEGRQNNRRTEFEILSK